MEGDGEPPVEDDEESSESMWELRWWMGFWYHSQQLAGLVGRYEAPGMLGRARGRTGEACGTLSLTPDSVGIRLPD